MNQGNKLQRQKKDSWSLGERKQRHRLEGTERQRHAPERAREGGRESALIGSFVLRGFAYFLKVGILGEFSGDFRGDLNRTFISFPRMSFSGLWSLLIG